MSSPLPPAATLPPRAADGPVPVPGDKLYYYYVWSGQSMCMLRLILMLNRQRISSGKRL
jgi:hypothetical protein